MITLLLVSNIYSTVEMQTCALCGHFGKMHMGSSQKEREQIEFSTEINTV